MFSAIFQGRWLGIYSEFMMALGVSGRWRAMEEKEKKKVKTEMPAQPPECISYHSDSWCGTLELSSKIFQFQIKFRGLGISYTLQLG